MVSKFYLQVWALLGIGSIPKCHRLARKHFSIVPSTTPLIYQIRVGLPLEAVVILGSIRMLQSLLACGLILRPYFFLFEKMYNCSNRFYQRECVLWKQGKSGRSECEECIEGWRVCWLFWYLSISARGSIARYVWAIYRINLLATNETQR